MTMIADRPVEASDRVQVGHWEGDCIMGVGNRSAIGTLVERTTRFVILIHVPTGRPTAAAMRDGITDALGALAPPLRRTLTWDQGKELALHHQITACNNRHPRVLLRCALRRGSGAATRTRMVCCATTFPNVRTEHHFTHGTSVSRR